jgi:hypothetical protein
MNYPLSKINENVNYASYTNSSAICWSSSSADQVSLAALIKNSIMILPQELQISSEVDPQLRMDH